MPFDNLGKLHFSDEQKTAVFEALQFVIESIGAMNESLTPKERTRYGKVGPQQELIIEKVKDYQKSQPENCAPDVDWEEFHLDYKDRKLAAQMLTMAKTIEEILLNVRILRDHDNYKAALSEYSYTQYRNRFSDGAAFSLKADEIRALFPKTGKKLKSKKS